MLEFVCIGIYGNLYEIFTPVSSRSPLKQDCDLSRVIQLNENFK